MKELEFQCANCRDKFKKQLKAPKHFQPVTVIVVYPVCDRQETIRLSKPAGVGKNQYKIETLDERPLTVEAIKALNDSIEAKPSNTKDEDRL